MGGGGRKSLYARIAHITSAKSLTAGLFKGGSSRVFKCSLMLFEHYTEAF